jgi:hypothetical protein
MPSDYAPFAADFYINMRMNLKMDLPTRRDTVLSFFDRLRKEMPRMDRFRRYTDELALETRTDADSDILNTGQQWVGVRRTSVRSGCVNPSSLEEGYRLHELIAEHAPYFLDISPLDIEQIELLWGFDLPANGNHDSIVFNALYHGSGLASAVDSESRTSTLTPIDCQPSISLSLNATNDLQAQIEVKTRSNTRAARSPEGASAPSMNLGAANREEPISVYMVVRKIGPFKDIDDIPGTLSLLARKGEELLDSRVLPRIVAPLREAIVTGG